MEKKDLNKTRKVPKLNELSEKDLGNVIRENEIEINQNELALMELDNMELGLNLHELNDKQSNFVFNYVDGEMYNVYNDKKTKNDLLNSFLMTFDNYEKYTKDIWEEKTKEIQDKDGNFDIVTYYVIKDYPLYMKWKARAMKYWNSHTLNNYVNGFRDLLEGNIDRRETLKDAIFNDAISDDVSERTMLESRKQMVDILGLKKERVSNSLNIFTSGGGREMAQSIDEIGGRGVNASELLDYDSGDD